VRGPFEQIHPDLVSCGARSIARSIADIRSLGLRV